MASTSTGLISRLLGNASFASIMRDGCVELRSGPPPASADEGAAGVLLGRITNEGLAWTPGFSTGGLRWAITDRSVAPETGQQWVLKGLASGVVGHFRVVANTPDAGGLSLDAPRLDGTVLELGSTAAADMYIPSTTITPATQRTVDLFWLTFL